MIYNSEKYFSTILQHIHQAICIVDFDLQTIVDCNDTACSFFSLSKQSLQNSKFITLLDKSSQHHFSAISKNAIPEHLHLTFVNMVQPCCTSVTSVDIENRLFLCLLIQISKPNSDCFERIDQQNVVDKHVVNNTFNKDENEFYRIKSLLESVIDKSPIPMMIASAPFGIIEFINPSCADFFQIPNYHQLIGTSILEYKQQWQEFDALGNKLQLKDSPFVKALKGIYSTNKEYKVVRPDGTVRYEMAHGVPIKDSNGTTIAAYVVYPDITMLKLQKQELKKQTDEIYLQNEEYRTLNEQLQNRNELISNMNNELIAAKEKAQESDTLKTAFLANMSHEIRTPMNAIIGFTELLNEDDGLCSEIKKQYIQIIQNSSNQLIRIISDILDIAKIEANQMPINIAQFNVNQLIKELFILFSKELEKNNKKHIELFIDKVDINQEVIIASDELRIRQILSNLLDNAIKFTSVGSIQFGYELAVSSITFYITDTGCGFKSKNSDRIFERFYQEETDVSKIAGGTGLGLSICKGLVDILGGSIVAKNNVDIGATFSFTIPLQCHVRSTKESSKGANASKALMLDLSNKTILIVEDEHEIYRFLEVVLQPTQARLIWKSNGEDACTELLANNNIDLVLMDVRLPGMNGLEITKKIKQQRPQLPIIVQTAYAMATDKHEAEIAGCNAFLTKPIRKNILFETIQRVFLEANKTF